MTSPQDVVTTSLVLLLAVAGSGVLARMLPAALPRPLVQIAVGAALGLTADLRVLLDPEVFFVLFLPPLLFLDGWRIPRDELLKDWTTVLELALGLVVFTVLGMGLLIHWLIPPMPLAVAFALAAILSPTDPIAVSAIARRVPIPRRMLHILEGESLLNDASGLVCFRFAVAAALTGTFSLSEASLTFLWVATGGLLAGALVSLLATRAKDWVSQRFGEDAGSQILISLLIPYGAYLAAEAIGCSGILAAVAAGVAMSRAEARGLALAETRISRLNVWDMIQYGANGVIFVLLGEQLPAILEPAARSVERHGGGEGWWLAGIVAAVTLGLAALRFVWVFVSLRLTLLRRRSEAGSANWRIVAAMSLSGVRGAVTLAGVLTLPLTLGDGTPFPARELAILVAMGVIVLSLVGASIALPIFLRGLELPPDTSRRAEEDAARIAAARAALLAIERFQRERRPAASEPAAHAELVASAATRAGDLYRRRIERRSHADDAAADTLARLGERIEQEMRLAALRAERAELFRLMRRREIGSETARRLIRELDLLETRYAGPG